MGVTWRKDKETIQQWGGGGVLGRWEAPCPQGLGQKGEEGTHVLRGIQMLSISVSISLNV